MSIVLLEINCRLLIAFANSLDPDQAQRFDTLMVFLKKNQKVNFEKISRRQKKDGCFHFQIPVVHEMLYARGGLHSASDCC